MYFSWRNNQKFTWRIGSLPTYRGDLTSMSLWFSVTIHEWKSQCLRHADGLDGIYQTSFYESRCYRMFFVYKKYCNCLTSNKSENILSLFIQPIEIVTSQYMVVKGLG